MASEDNTWGVMDAIGCGYGWYATKKEAEDRRDNLLQLRDGEGGFVVVRVIP